MTPSKAALLGSLSVLSIGIESCRNDGPFDTPQLAVYMDSMQSYSTTEPAIDHVILAVVVEDG